MPVKCFVIFKTAFTFRYLRRYARTDEKCEASGYGYHNAENFLDKGLIGEASTTAKVDLDKTDPRWPTHCACGYKFKPEDNWQLNVEQEWVNANGMVSTFRLRDAPAGAMWHEDYRILEGSNENRGPDGHCLVVRLPNGEDWYVDSRAGNCGSPDDDVHKCWIRHGEPPNITVDKNGVTCTAGAGSINSREGKPNAWHGFLRNGELVL